MYVSWDKGGGFNSTYTFVWIALYINAPDVQIVELETTKATSVPKNKNHAAKISPQVSSSLRHLSVIFEKYILSSIPKFVYTYPAGTLAS